MNMPNLHMPADIEADFWRELREIEAESLGWVPLAHDAWLHAGDPQASVVTIVGQPDTALAGQAILLVGY
jgi:hypothetical protein